MTRTYHRRRNAQCSRSFGHFHAMSDADTRRTSYHRSAQKFIKDARLQFDLKSHHQEEPRFLRGISLTKRKTGQRPKNVSAKKRQPKVFWSIVLVCHRYLFLAIIHRVYPFGSILVEDYSFLPTAHPFLATITFSWLLFGKTPGSQTGCSPRVLVTAIKREDKNPSLGAPAGTLRIGSVISQSPLL